MSLGLFSPDIFLENILIFHNLLLRFTHDGVLLLRFHEPINTCLITSQLLLLIRWVPISVTPLSKGSAAPSRTARRGKGPGTGSSRTAATTKWPRQSVFSEATTASQ